MSRSEDYAFEHCQTVEHSGYSNTDKRIRQLEKEVVELRKQLDLLIKERSIQNEFKKRAIKINLMR